MLPLEKALLTAGACLLAVPPLCAQSSTYARLPPKGCWTKDLVWTLARQDLPVADPTRWTVIAQERWSRWDKGIPMQTVRGDQLTLTVTTVDNWQILLTSGPTDAPAVLSRLDVLCTFAREEPGVRLVFTTRAFH